MRTAAAVVSVLFALASCSRNRDATPRATRSSPTFSPTPAIAVDWAHLRDMRPIDADGWSFVGCRGDAPLLCVERRGVRVGLVELLLFGRDTFADTDDVDSIAADNIESFRKDRVTSCPSGHSFRARPVVHRTVAGIDGRRTEWTVIDDERRVVERVVTYFAVDADRVIVLGANALADGGCLSREGAEFTPNVLSDLLPVLDLVVAGSRLPAPAT